MPRGGTDEFSHDGFGLSGRWLACTELEGSNRRHVGIYLAPGHDSSVGGHLLQHGDGSTVTLFARRRLVWLGVLGRWRSWDSNGSCSSNPPSENQIFRSPIPDKEVSVLC